MFEAKLAIVRYLRRFLPYSDAITPRFVSPVVSSLAFVEAAQGLQDQGPIVYEVLLVGAGREPILGEAMLTRKGQQWEPGGDASGHLATGRRHFGACCKP